MQSAKSASKEDMETPSRAIHTVTSVVSRIQRAVETELPVFWISGEVSNLVRSAAGHWYFSLKDESSQLRCVMFKGRNALVRFQLNEGDEILVCGKVGIYKNRGDLQVVVERMEPSGLGELQRNFELLKNRLREEGLFDAKFKKQLPLYPGRVGLITSPSGAALHDMLTVLNRRAPGIAIQVYPSLVQGKDAAKNIGKMIELANTHQLCDLLIVGRGGGSLEDLWAFNEEAVARAISASELPIVSAIGHETDFTIADMVADIRAPTPSAAAEIVSASTMELTRNLSHLNQSLTHRVDNILQNKQRIADHLTGRLRTPASSLREKIQQLDYLYLRLNTAARELHGSLQHRMTVLEKRLQSLNPEQSLTHKQNILDQRVGQLHRGTQTKLLLLSNRLKGQSQLVEALGPQSTLNRGFAVVSNSSGNVVRDPQRVKTGEVLNVKVAKGRFEVKVS